MSLLQEITRASLDRLQSYPETKYPLTLNPDPLFLKPEHDDPDWKTMLTSAETWPISQTDTKMINLNDTLFRKLKKKLKNPLEFKKDDFLIMINKHLKNVGEVVGISGVSFEEGGEKLRALLGRDLKGLVLEACLVLEDWESLEKLIVNGVVEHSSSSSLVNNLIEKRRSDLLVLCVNNLSDFPIYDLMCVLKYFLSTPMDGIHTMGNVRKEWESQALLAIEKVSHKSSKSKNENFGKDASLWIMMAYDGFSVSELCLHHFLASKNLDGVIRAACMSKLDMLEIMSLMKYLAKWLKKYERFPQAGPCPNAASVLGLKVCDWIPTQEAIIKCLGLVVDEHFSSLVLHQEFHEELKSLGSFVTSIAGEASLCGSIANLTNIIRSRPAESFLEKLQSSFLLYGD